MFLKTNRFQHFLWYWLPLLLWMVLIFVLSHQDKDHSRRTSEWVLWLLSLLHIDLESLKASGALLYVRKLAHFSIYFVLAFWSFRLFKWKWQPPRLWWAVWGFCVIYAASDEFHQLFVPGRVGSLLDVGIDSLGAAACTGMLILAQRLDYRPLAA
ncbi:MAG: VanZ family protein [Bacteroidetes bacterium]|nr:MAG: VanZ family protein [Bacteroidota bacterium]